MSQLPEGSFATTLQNAVVELCKCIPNRLSTFGLIYALVYNDLPHPAGTYVGTEYGWRTADGSGNNLSDPDMGKAHKPYSRSVQQLHTLRADSLPDPGLIFDTLLRRDKVHILSASMQPCLTRILLVHRAPCWSLELDVRLCRARHPHVRPCMTCCAI